MIPSNIMRDHILKALIEIDNNGVPPEREATKYELIYQMSKYPPKYVISIANKFANGIEHQSTLFSGGPETNAFLQNRGFEVREMERENTLRDILYNVMDSWNKKTSEYLSRSEPVYQLLREGMPNIVNRILRTQGYDEFMFNPGLGQGNWIEVPFLVIRDPERSPGPREGVYIVYLFSEMQDAVYLTINQGAQNSTQSELTANAERLRRVAKTFWLD